MRRLLAAFVCLLLAAPAVARTISVDNDAPADFATIQAAIDDANDGDTVEIRPGTYTGPGNRDIEFKGKAITVRSTDPNDPNIVAATIIDCNGTAEEPHRGFNFISEEDQNSVLAGLTITRGYAPNQPEVYDRSVGGAIYILGSPTIFRCVISVNCAQYDGGGIYVKEESEARIAYCTITQNSVANRGGGIYCNSNHDVTIDHCIIDRNCAECRGGGVYCAYYAEARISHCTMTGNSAGMSCGGISASAAIISHCIVWGNSARLAPDISGSPSVSYSYCDIGVDPPAGTGNISADPCFVDQATGDYHLSADSPCVHAGDPLFIASTGQVDFDGEPRVLFGRIDVGADEFSDDGPYLYISPNNFVFEANEGGENPAPRELSITNVGTDTLNWSISQNCPWLNVTPPSGMASAGETDSVSVAVDVSGLLAGLHSCRVTVTDPCALNRSQSGTITMHIDDGGNVLHVPSEYPTIQEAIDWAEAGDTVILAPGIYTGEGNRDVDFLGKAITVRSTDPTDFTIVAATVIDCEGSLDDRHRGFIFQNGEDANSVISGLTIRGGYEDYGGAVYCYRLPGPAIRYCTIAANTACAGGGIYIAGEVGSPVIENCIIAGNRAMPNPNYWVLEEGHGGGIFFAGYGGWWYGDNSSRPTIANCTISGNIASYRGGGVCAMLNCGVTVTNSIVWGNTAPHDNDIGIWLVCDAPNPHYAISYNNIKDGLDGIDVDYFVEWGNGNIDACPCFVEPGYWDPNATPTDANDDFWVHGDYHLMSRGWRWDMPRRTWIWDLVTSRCIDAGNPGSPLGDELLSAPTDPGNDWGQNLRINMGAYGGTSEASIPPHDWMLWADITGDGYVHFDDLAALVADWLSSGYERPGDFSRNALINLLDFAVLAGDWPKQTTWAWQAWNPNPPDGSVGIRLDPVLSWESGYAAVSHDVYFGPTYPPEFQVNQTANTFTPGHLSMETAYYWRIDEISPYDTTTGGVWSFTTTPGAVR
ncbi:MAG: right-handed parallel beta-helix repeat-containing protein [Sedimentisphaerales bacterium]|nr:right-handed parallel beta-helix repeat-containing protein [Sedimentisphaerales bacterium]